VNKPGSNRPEGDEGVVRAQVDARVTAGPPRAGNRLTRAMSRALLGLAGWRIVGRVPDEPKVILVGAPHTSYIDFVLTKLTAGTCGVRLHWVGKKALFPARLAPIVRWFGGIPVNREASEGFVGAMVEEFRRRDAFYLAVMPEGTLRDVAAWRSGFYHIALGADVPMLLIGFDWGRRTMRIGPVVRPNPLATVEDEIAGIRRQFDGIDGRRRRARVPAGREEGRHGHSAV
jgi:hypothetical protein